jgi:hypothetical protein
VSDDTKLIHAPSPRQGQRRAAPIIPEVMAAQSDLVTVLG